MTASWDPAPRQLCDIELFAERRILATRWVHACPDYDVGVTSAAGAAVCAGLSLESRSTVRPALELLELSCAPLIYWMTDGRPLIRSDFSNQRVLRFPRFGLPGETVHCSAALR